MNTATIDLSVLATSNGHSEKDRMGLGSTSKGSANAAGRVRGEILGAVVLGGIIGGILAVVGLR